MGGGREREGEGDVGERERERERESMGRGKVCSVRAVAIDFIHNRRRYTCPQPFSQTRTAN